MGKVEELDRADVAARILLINCFMVCDWRNYNFVFSWAQAYISWKCEGSNVIRLN